MAYLKDIERVLYNNPIIDMEQYTPMDGMNMEIMNIESHAEGYSCVGYAYIRRNKKDWFVDIYIYDFDKTTSKMSRFVIAPGFILSEEDEKEMLRYLNMFYIIFNERICASFVSEINEIAPELHVRDYEDFGRVLFHTYYTSHRSGIREQLFKMGLDEIGYYLDVIEDYNVLGSNVSNAFDLPMKLLQKLNTGFGILKVLKNEQTRFIAKNIYEKYHSQINDIKVLKEYQWKYLVDCYESGETLDKVVLKQLGNMCFDIEEDFNIEDLYNEYKLYRRNRSSIGEYRRIFPRYPDINDTDKFRALSDIVKSYAENGPYIDTQIRIKSAMWREYFSYEDEHFIIIIPTCLEHILQEADNMKNCLYTYVFSIIKDDTIVVFMRDKKYKNKSLVTVEIKNGKLCQAKQACNMSITIEQKDFLRKFACQKGLDFTNNIEEAICIA